MASRKELERRKERLLRQNDIYRRNLRNEAGNLREAAEWAERGHSFYRAGMKLRSWMSPFSSRKKSSPLEFLLKSCSSGLKIFR